MTLIELSVLVVVLLFLLGMGFVGVKAWKAGSDRAACILNIYHAQEAMRAFSNLNGFESGQTLALNLEDEIFGSDKYMRALVGCPARGGYTTKGNVIPKVGELYLSCSLAGSKGHEPERHVNW